MYKLIISAEGVGNHTAQCPELTDTKPGKGSTSKRSIRDFFSKNTKYKAKDFHLSFTK